MATPLLGSLPDELTLLIVEHLAADSKTLCALARTSRGLQQVAEEHLYRTIELLSVKGLHTIIDAFSRRAERVRAVHSLKILYTHKPRDLRNGLGTRKVFNDCVARMVNLREWCIESPYDNFNWEKSGHEWVEGDMESFRAALERACGEGRAEEERVLREQALGKRVERTVGLALLQRLTIHSHGAHADFWSLQGFHCLFRHPSLRYLHVSCITFPDHLPELEAHARSSPLTTLEFNECELKTGSLRHVLRTPRHLKHLTLGENVFNINKTTRLAPRLTKDPDASLAALAAVAHSLETLTHFDPTWQHNRVYWPGAGRVRPSGQGMRHFHSLRVVECDTSSFLHEAVLRNYDLAPPNLHTLRIRRHWKVHPSLFDQLPQVETYLSLPSLSTVEFVQSAPSYAVEARPSYICAPDRLRNRHAYAYKLYKRGANMKVSIEMHKSEGLIPPYLHGERVPVEGCFYDAEQVGFHRHIIDTLENVVGNPSVHELFPDAHILSSDEPSSPLPPSLPAEKQDAEKHEAAKKEAEKLDAKLAPETDQLGNADIQRMTSASRRALDLVSRALHPNRSAFSRILYYAAGAQSDGQQTVFALEDDSEDSDDDWSDESLEGDDMDLPVLLPGGDGHGGMPGAWEEDDDDEGDGGGSGEEGSEEGDAVFWALQAGDADVWETASEGDEEGEVEVVGEDFASMVEELLAGAHPGGDGGGGGGGAEDDVD